MSEPARLVVLVSGEGTNLQALLDACANGGLEAQIVGVASNRPEARGLDRARAQGVEAIAVVPEPGESRGDYDSRLASVVAQWDPHWVVLAGFMRLLSMSFLARFPDRVLNVHPARPGELPGVGAIARAHDEAVAGRRDRTGVMVHLVPDEGMDSGPVVLSEDVAIEPGLTLEDLENRMHAVEHRVLVAALQRLVEFGLPDALERPGG